MNNCLCLNIGTEGNIRRQHEKPVYRIGKVHNDKKR